MGDQGLRGHCWHPRVITYCETRGRSFTFHSGLLFSPRSIGDENNAIPALLGGGPGRREKTLAQCLAHGKSSANVSCDHLYH